MSSQLAEIATQLLCKCYRFLHVAASFICGVVLQDNRAIVQDNIAVEGM